MKGAQGPDHAPVLASDGDALLVLLTSEEGEVRSHLDTGDGFVAGEPFAAGLRYGGLAGAVPHDGGWLYLGQQAWRRTDGGPELETGAGDVPDPAWPVAGQTLFGHATLVAPGVVEYSLEDGTVVATYQESEGGAGCD